MQDYKRLLIDVLLFDEDDIITTSPGNDSQAGNDDITGPDDNWGGWIG